MHGQQRLYCWLGIIAQGPVDQDFEEIYYFQSMRLHKEALGAIVQTNVGSITEKVENIGAVVWRELIELLKLPSPALVGEILKLEALIDIKQDIVSTTSTESRVTVKYLKDMSTMLAVVSAVRFPAERNILKLKFAFNHIN